MLRRVPFDVNGTLVSSRTPGGSAAGRSYDGDCLHLRAPYPDLMSESLAEGADKNDQLIIPRKVVLVPMVWSRSTLP